MSSTSKRDPDVLLSIKGQVPLEEVLSAPLPDHPYVWGEDNQGIPVNQTVRLLNFNAKKVAGAFVPVPVKFRAKLSYDISIFRPRKINI